MKRVKPYLPATGVFVLALLVRVIYNRTVALNYVPLHDSLFYQTIGLNLVSEHCFCLHPYVTTVYRAPLWPFILAAFSIFFGPNNLMPRLFLSVLDAGTCLIVYLFARDLFGRRFGTFAGIVAAIYPGLFIYTGWLYTETLFTFFLFALCYALYRIQRGQGQQKWLWPLCGLLLGSLSLVRPNGVLVIALFLVWAAILIWIKIMPRAATIRGALLAALIALVIVAPWTVRNYLVSHAFIPVATGDGTVLLGAYNNQVLDPNNGHGEFLGTWINPLISRPGVAYAFPLINCPATCEVAREHAFSSAAQQWMLQNLGRMPLLLTLHFVNMFQPAALEADLPMYRFPNATLSGFVLGMMDYVPIPIFLLAAFGLVATFFRWRELFFLYFMIAMTFGLGIYFYGIARFRAPIEPMLILLATGALWWIVTQWRGSRG